MNTYLLRVAFKVWLIEIIISGFNFFVLMNQIYEPLFGSLRAHQIGMTTRIIYIFILSYLLLRFVKSYTTFDSFIVGIFWLILTLIFEWGGSFLIGRPISEILIGWNISAGYMWPYVLLTYLFSNLLVGIILQPGKILKQKNSSRTKS